MSHPSLPDIRVDYLSRSDTLDVRNVVLPRNHVHEATDITEADARTIAQGAFDALLSAGVVEPSHVDFSQPTVHTITETQARSDGSLAETWVSTYLISAPLRINGLVVFQNTHDLGVLIEVHRSGEIRRIRVDCLGLVANEPGWRANGSTVSVALRSADAQSEAAAGVTNAVVESIGMRYLYPPNGNAAPALPREVYRVHSTFRADDGSIGRTKASIFSYDVGNGSPVREIFPKTAAVVLKSDRK